MEHHPSLLDPHDKENIDPASLRAHGGGGKGDNDKHNQRGNGGGFGGSGGNKADGDMPASGTASAATKKRKLPAGSESSVGLRGKAPGAATQPPQRKRPLLRSCSTPPPSSSSSAVPAKQAQRHKPAFGLAAAMEINATDSEYNGNDENADPMQRQQKHGPLQALQQQQAQRRSEAGNKRMFGLLNDRSLPKASTTASAAGTDYLLARLNSYVNASLGKEDGEGGEEQGTDERGTSPFNEGYGTRRTLPQDMSLKSALCFEAKRPFDWARAIPGHVEARGMLHHLREAAGVMEPTVEEDGEEEEGGFATGMGTAEEAQAAFVAASYYYAHPADRLPARQHLGLQQVRRQMDGVFAPRDAAPVMAGAWQPQGGEQPPQQQAEQGAGAGIAALYRRMREWEEAFRHLYGQYRHDAGMAFYTVAPEFTVAWTREEKGKGKGAEEEEEDAEEEGSKAAPSERLVPASDQAEQEEEDEEDGQPRLKAVISTSKRWLRERLRAHRIPFRMPLAPDAAAVDLDDGPAPDVRAELEALQQHNIGVGGHNTVHMEVVTSRRRRPVVGGPGAEVPRHRSQLVVEGALAVHGLFTFLSDLGNALAPSAVGDVPRLLAPKPFAHGVLGRLQVAANTPVQRTLVGGEGGMETVYQLKLRGPVLPCQLRRLAGVVHFFNGRGKGGGGQAGQEEQEEDWSLTMEVAPGTEAFNGITTEGEGKEREGAGPMSMKEVRYHAGKGRFVTIRIQNV